MNAVGKWPGRRAKRALRMRAGLASRLGLRLRERSSPMSAARRQWLRFSTPPRWPQIRPPDGGLTHPAAPRACEARLGDAPLGARTAHTIPVDRLRRAFAGVLYLLAAYMLYKGLSA